MRNWLLATALVLAACGAEEAELGQSAATTHAAEPDDSVIPPLSARTEYQGPLESGGDDGSVVDVMMLFTPAVLHGEFQGDWAATRARMAEYIHHTNRIVSNSLIPMRFRLVYAGGIQYSESGDLGTDLERLRNPNDGIMDVAHTERNQYRADIVTLVVASSNDGYAGRGYIMTSDYYPPGGGSWDMAPLAFNVVKLGSTKVLAHEIGHNMGCAHNVEHGHPNWGYAGGVFPYSYGHRQSLTGEPPVAFRTIMSYACSWDNYCGWSPLDVFSTPHVYERGYPVGWAGQRDNARTISETRFYVASFRQSLHGICPGDTDGDRRVGYSDTLNILGHWVEERWGECPGCDTNGDGRINMGDILSVQSNWGRVCP